MRAGHMDVGSNFHINQQPGHQFTLRPGQPNDAAACGKICYHAFKAIAERHDFPPDFPSIDVAQGLLAYTLSSPAIRSVVAEMAGEVVGSNFLWISGTVAGVGPITIDPACQNVTVGRQLMDWALDTARDAGVNSVRLVQAAYHNRSLALYTKMGFVAREPLSTMQGSVPRVAIPGYKARAASEADVAACTRLHQSLNGYSREGDLRNAIAQGTAMVVEHDGRISGYATQIAFFGHAVGESNEDIKALICAAPEFAGPGFLLPTRNTALLLWCLEQGLKIVQPMTLMSQGFYNEPSGAFMPSILY
ncbi:GNAT superfamily N-acetyltransferase [Limibacillus sp. MBR-115]